MWYHLKSCLIKAILVVLLVQNAMALGKLKSNIVGGLPSTIAKQKYLVQVLTGTTLCGGSLIASNWVLTAAHCVNGVNAAKLQIIGGSTFLGDPTGGVLRSVSRVFVAPLYNTQNQNMDAALLKLSSPMSGVNIAPIARGSAVAAGSKILVSGWGLTQEDGDVSQQVQNVEVTVQDSTACSKAYAGVSAITNYMFCASAPGKDSCSGDSGGPAVFNNQLVGIVSFGVGCARNNFPGVYTSVAAVESWLKQTLSANA